MGSRRRIELAVTLAVLLASARLTAQAGTSEAERLFYEARALLEAKAYDSACAKLERSQKLDPGLGTLALLAYCHEQQGRTATAHAEYGQALRWAERQGDADRYRLIEQQRQRLAPKLSTLRVIVAEPAPGLEVYVASERVERAAWGVPVPVDPGTVVVRARAPGFVAWRRDISVGADGARAQVEIPALDRESSVQPSSSRSVDVPAAVALGVGALGVGIGSYFGLRASSLNDESDENCDAQSRCTQAGFDTRKDAQSAARVANVAFVIGAAGLATGVVLWLARDGDERPTTALRVTPAPRGARAMFEQAF